MREASTICKDCRKKVLIGILHKCEPEEVECEYCNFNTPKDKTSTYDKILMCNSCRSGIDGDAFTLANVYQNGKLSIGNTICKDCKEKVIDWLLAKTNWVEYNLVMALVSELDKPHEVISDS